MSKNRSNRRKVVCEYCNKKFEVKPSLTKRKYCNARCSVLARTKTVPLKEDLYKLYIQEQKSLLDIAEIYSVSGELISVWLKLNGIEKRTRSQSARTVPVCIKGMEIKGQSLPQNLGPDKISKSGKREDLDNQFVRSGWEANVIRLLNNIGVDWQYEPRTFVFKNITRGPVSYTPDFYLPLYEDGGIWIEVKGRVMPGTYSKLKNFKEQYPEEFTKLTMIVQKNTKAHKLAARLGIPIFGFYGELVQSFKHLDNWE